MNYTIRFATVNDALQLTALFNSDTNVLGEDETLYGKRDLLEYINDSRKRIFVFEINGSIGGALMADYHDTYAYLDTLIVDKHLQANGIGSRLFDHFETDLKMKNIPLIEVLTEVDNEVMKRILEKRGFRKGQTFMFYAKGE